MGYMARREDLESRFHEGALQRMTTMSRDEAGCRIERRACWQDTEIAELSLLLPAGQAAQMERLAHSRNLTLGQLIRRLIRDYLTDRVATGPVNNQPVGSLAIPRGDGFDSQGPSP
jgi:hypothetical protein